ncbi:MAG: DJ-1/PfpI family protein, partial [Solirubrobacterales bacterium]
MAGRPETRRWIGILLFETMEEIDGIGPWEVFAWWTAHYPDDGWSATTFSADGKPVTCEKTLVVTPHHSADTLPPLDVLVHPGGDGALRLREDEAHLEWMRGQREKVPVVASVCTGAEVLAAAGLLRDRPATSNQRTPDELNRIDPTIDV